MRSLAPALLLVAVQAGCTLMGPLPGGGVPPAPPEPEPVRPGVCPATDGQIVMDGMNRARDREGLPALLGNARLRDAALMHARDLARAGTLGHTGSDGSSPGDRAERAGYDWRAVAENVAGGVFSATEVTAGWLRSEGHRRNILGAAYRDAGVARVDDPTTQWRTYWVVVFGRTEALDPDDVLGCHP